MAIKSKAQRTSGLAATAAQLMASYGSEMRLARVATPALPSREQVQRLIGELWELLFPGFFSAPTKTRRDLARKTHGRLQKFASLLGDLMVGCAGLGESSALAGKKGTASLSENICRQLPKLRSLLLSDVEAAYQGDPACKTWEEIVVAYPFLKAVAIQRFSHLLYRSDIVLLPRLLTEYGHSLTGIDIHPGAKIAEHFFIDHATGVVIGETAEIGSHVKIYQGVTLGALSVPKPEKSADRQRKRHPTIGDHVTIYANATILGPTRIGSGSIIGGNVWVTEDVPENSVVLFNPKDIEIRPRQRTKR